MNNSNHHDHDHILTPAIWAKN